MTRKEIMDKCPDEFKSDLKDFIDDVESRVNDVQGKLEVKSIDDIGSISDASNDLDDLATDLY